jgi:two-component system, OmpR family, flagellar system response regulator FtcR
MIIILDDSCEVTNSFCVGLHREGLAANGREVTSIEAIVIGQYESKYEVINLIKSKTNMPIIAINRSGDLESMLNLFLAGADDVVFQVVQAREIAARIGAIRRRIISHVGYIAVGLLRVYFDGRDPDINGVAFVLPRRERRILEYLAFNRARRVNRTMIFNAVYGLFEEEVDESVVESHISKLRKKLRILLGFDPIDNQRYLGYQLQYQKIISSPDLKNGPSNRNRISNSDLASDLETGLAA